MRLNNKTTMIIVFVVLLIFLVLTLYFKANPVTNDKLPNESSTETSALDSQKLVVNTDGDENERALDFYKTFVFSVPNNVTEPSFGLTVTGGCKFATNSGKVEFMPINDGSLYTLNVTPNWNPKMDPNIITSNFETTFTNVEYIEADNKVVVYIGGTFTFSDNTNTFTHDINERFEINFADYIN